MSLTSALQAYLCNSYMDKGSKRIVRAVPVSNCPYFHKFSIKVWAGTSIRHCAQPGANGIGRNHSVSSAFTVPEQTLLCFFVLVTLACLPAPLRSLLKRTLQRGAAATCRCCALRASPPPMCGSTTCGTTGRSITPSCWNRERCVSLCKAGAIHAAPAARANIIACCA